MGIPIQNPTKMLLLRLTTPLHLVIMVVADLVAETDQDSEQVMVLAETDQEILPVTEHITPQEK